MRPKPGQYLTLLECSFVEGATPNVFDAGVFEGPVQLNQNYGGGRPEKDTQFQVFLRDQGIKEATELIRTFLVTQFMKVVDQGNEYEYKVTNTIAKVLLNEFAFVRKDDFTPVEVVADGIAYASIAAEAIALSQSDQGLRAWRSPLATFCRACGAQPSSTLVSRPAIMT